MSRVKTLALSVAVLFALAGCAQMFEFNLFGALDTPPTPTAADYQGAGGLDQLAQDLDSPAIVGALAADPTLVATILTNLATDYLDGPLPPFAVVDATDGEAAVLYADLALKTTEGEDLVNNIFETILEGSISSSSTIADILAGIIPPEALADEDTFAAMIDALLAANDAYLALGDYVDGFDGDGVAENPLPPGALPGDVAQKALVAYTIAVVVAAVEVSHPADARTQLYLIATGGAYDTGLDGVKPDPYASPDPAIVALLDVAGVSIP